MATCVTKNCCLAGAGTIYLREYNSCCDGTNEDVPFLSIGNSSAFTVNAELLEVKVPNYQTVGGGTECSFSQIESATAAITNLCLNATNFARAWTGDLTAKAATTSTISGKAVAVDSFIPYVDATGKPITNVTTSSVTVTGLGTAGTDYIVKSNGLYIPETSTLNFASPISFTGSVTHSGYSLVEMLTSTSKEFTLFYDGVNRFGGQPFSVTLYRVKLKPVSGIPLLGTEAAAAEYELEILRDECRPGTGTFSQYGSLVL